MTSEEKPIDQAAAAEEALRQKEIDKGLATEAAHAFLATKPAGSFSVIQMRDAYPAAQKLGVTVFKDMIGVLLNAGIIKDVVPTGRKTIPSTLLHRAFEITGDVDAYLHAIAATGSYEVAVAAGTEDLELARKSGEDFSRIDTPHGRREAINELIENLKQEALDGKKIDFIATSNQPSVDTTIAVMLLQWYGNDLLGLHESLMNAGVYFVADGAQLVRGNSGKFVKEVKRPKKHSADPDRFDRMLPLGVGERAALDEHGYKGPGRDRISAGRLVAVALGIVPLEGRFGAESKFYTPELVSKRLGGKVSVLEVARLHELIRYGIEDDTRGRDRRGDELSETQPISEKKFFELGQIVKQMWRYSPIREDIDDGYAFAKAPIHAYIAACARAATNPDDFGDLQDPRLNAAVLLDAAFTEWKNEREDSINQNALGVINSYVGNKKNLLLKAQGAYQKFLALGKDAPDEERAEVTKNAKETAEAARVSPFELAGILGYMAQAEGREAAIKWAKQALTSVYERSVRRAQAQEIVKTDVQFIKHKDRYFAVYERPTLPDDVPQNFEVGSAAFNRKDDNGRDLPEEKQIHVFIDRDPPLEGYDSGNARIFFSGRIAIGLIQRIAAGLGRAELEKAGDTGTYRNSEFFDEGNMPGKAANWYCYPTYDRDEKGERYLKGIWLLNGSLKHPGITPTRLSTDELKVVVMTAIDNHVEARLRREKTRKPHAPRPRRQARKS